MGPPIPSPRAPPSRGRSRMLPCAGRSAMNVSPFRGLRPRADLAARIPSLPYDVLDSDEARRLAAGDPYTFLHVVKSEIDLDPAVDLHDPRVYAKARENLDALRAKGWMVRDPQP